MKDNALNEVIRIKKSPTTFAVMDKVFLENSNLSWKSKGMLAYLLSKPDNWKVVAGDLINRSKDGKTAVYSALKELKEQGYYVKVPVKNKKGYFDYWQSTVYESSQIELQKQEKLEKKSKEETKSPNEIIRIKKSPSTIVVIDKGFLENPNLSWKSKGVLAYLLSKPDNWKVIAGDLINRSKDGKSAVYSALKELTQQGYYVRRPVRNKKGYFEYWESTIYESSQIEKQEPKKSEKKLKESKGSKKAEETSYFFSRAENLEMDKPENKNSENENKGYNNTYYSNNNCNKNDYSNSYYKSNLSISTCVENQIEEIDKKDDIEIYIEQVKNKIGYQDLYTSDNEGLLNVIVNSIVDIITSDTSTVIIGGVKKPLEFVKKIFLNLKRNHIAGVLQRFRAVKTQVRNVRQYLLACIFNAGLEDDVKVTETNAISTSNRDRIVPTVDCDGAMRTAAETIIRPNSKNKFNDFPQRQYTKEDFDELERKLLEKSFKKTTYKDSPMSTDANEIIIRPNPKNKFNDFPQRQYTKADFDEIEKRFLNKRKRERICKETSNTYGFLPV